MKKFALLCLLLLIPVQADAQQSPTAAPPLPLTPKANVRPPNNLAAPETKLTPGFEATAPTPINEYVPFPQNFDSLDQAGKDAVSKSIDDNTDKYFHSKEFGMALARFVEMANPKNIHECHELSMDRAANKITIIEPLLFAQKTDRHPMVGKWEQGAAFTGCGKTYTFTIEGEAHKGGTPILTVKP